ncbi:MAG: hypothetical protein ACXV78_06100 [Candidatus Angelobacter sp.]
MKNRASMNASAASPASPDRQTLVSAGELRPSVWALRNDALLSPLISTGRNGLVSSQAVRSPGALRLHSAFNELNLAHWLINSESQGKPQDVHEPILITNQGILLAGFAEWHAAVCAGQGEIVCIEFALNADEALQLILTLHRPRAAWNDFTRTELALEQEPYFQSKALANQIAGGKHKGLANLPKAEHIDVREKIADLAGVSPRTVGTVKIILKKAHPSLVEALHDGTITINAALQLCQQEKSKQVEQLALFVAERLNSKTNRESIDKLRIEKLSADVRVFLANLQQFEATNPGSVEVRPGTGKKTIIVVGKGHLNTLAGELPAGLA